MPFFDNLSYELKKQSTLTLVIIVNIVLFLVINIIYEEFRMIYVCRGN